MDDSPSTRDPAATGDVAIVAELLGSSASALLPLYANRAARVDHLLDFDHGFSCFRVWNLRIEQDGPPPRDLDRPPCAATDLRDQPNAAYHGQPPSVPVLIVAGRYVRLSRDCRGRPLLHPSTSSRGTAGGAEARHKGRERLEEGDAE